MEDLIKQNENKYLEYISNHKLNVQKAWNIMKNNNECLNLFLKYSKNTNIDSIINLVDELIINHDSSKYSIEEFDAYRKNYFPISENEKELNKKDFDLAWKHHYTNNLHHWDWWYESGNCNSMPLVYVIEMMCDWEAMSYQFGTTTKQWYEKEKDKIHLGDMQRKFVEELIEIINK